MDFSSPVWLGAIVRQTDPSSYTYISLHTTFRVVLWFVDDGPPTAFYRSPMLLSFPVSSPGASAGKPSNWMVRVVITIFATCSNPSSSSPLHRRPRLFFISKHSAVFFIFWSSRPDVVVGPTSVEQRSSRRGLSPESNPKTRSKTMMHRRNNPLGIKMQGHPGLRTKT